MRSLWVDHLRLAKQTLRTHIRWLRNLEARRAGGASIFKKKYSQLELCCIRFIGWKKVKNENTFFELICQLKFVKSRTQWLSECNFLSAHMKYFNVNYRKECQYLDEFEWMEKCAQSAHVRNMQGNISQINSAHMKIRSTLALIPFICYKINLIKGKFIPRKSVPVTFAILLICSTVKSELYSLSEMRLSSATKQQTETKSPK